MVCLSWQVESYGPKGRSFSPSRSWLRVRVDSWIDRRTGVAAAAVGWLHTSDVVEKDLSQR